jgi:pimeloyl-ACP methyl ester carboxylesterase
VARPSKQQQDAARPAPRLRRAYYDCRYGQLHLHNAIPGGGGFDELTAVLCIHGSGETGRVFMPLLAILGYERSVYAPDLPGRGESDPAPGEAAVDAGVQALADFLDSMRIRSVDLITRGDGQEIGQRLAKLRGAAVRRVAHLTAAEAQAPDAGRKLLAMLGGSAPPT